MPDFRIADTAPEHPKLRAAGLAAAGLWALAGGYAMRELTDGWVPESWVLTWPAGKRHAATLVTVGLWSRETRNGLPGYRFHDWLDYQRPAAKIHEERRKGRERAQRSRERSALRAADVRDASHDSRALTRALPPGGPVGGNRPVPDARRRATPPALDAPNTPNGPLTSRYRPVASASNSGCKPSNKPLTRPNSPPPNALCAAS